MDRRGDDDRRGRRAYGLAWLSRSHRRAYAGGDPLDTIHILLNLAFSTQAAYAAPLILLAAKRQADRDKLNAIADAKHREEIAQL